MAVSMMTTETILLSSIVQSVLDYWKSKTIDRMMPARRDIDPCEIPQLLPWLILTDVFYDPSDFRYRLIGTQVVAQARRDYTGKRFSEMDHTGPASTVWIDRMKVVQMRQPVFSAPPYSGPKAGVATVSGIHLPLSSDGWTVDMILTAVDFAMVLKTRP
jgi:hypothetical protein